VPPASALLDVLPLHGVGVDLPFESLAEVLGGVAVVPVGDEADVVPGFGVFDGVDGP